MGEKSGGLTNMVMVLVALVIITAFIKTIFPEVTGVISDQIRSIIDVSPEDYM